MAERHPSNGPVLILAGGTGGHVFPGLAVAADLSARGLPVAWLGTATGIEHRLVPAAGIPLTTMPIRSLRGAGWDRWLLAPVRLLAAVVRAARVLRQQRPCVVLGLGGYVAGPGGVAARLLRIPLVIHEQNAIAGLTNRLLSRLATRVLCGFAGAFKALPAVDQRTEWVGNPVRPTISAVADAEACPIPDRAIRLLVVGGSQGARVLNEVVPAALARLPVERRPQVRHQSGSVTHAVALEAYRSHRVDAEVLPFIDDMAEAYRWCDLVICRAGALTVTELAAAGRAAILVPLPQAADDHQTANARLLVEAGAGWLLPQARCDATALAGLLAGIDADVVSLRARGARGRTLAADDSASRIATICLEVAA